METVQTALELLHTDRQTFKKVTVTLVQDLFVKAAKRKFFTYY
jgi:hypothetical protein